MSAGLTHCSLPLKWVKWQEDLLSRFTFLELNEMMCALTIALVGVASRSSVSSAAMHVDRSTR